MAREYQKAEELLKRDEERPFVKRVFMILLLATPLVEFLASHATVEDVLKPDRNQSKGRYALRTQVIRDPTRPLGNGAEVLQFFMVDPNRDQMLRGGPGVIYEVDDKGTETPLLMLTESEVDLLVHGEGFSTALRT